ncbi:hypothetical protein [Nonomuraea guangzhouensis]|uniref:Uncharacterized protein n=1 Tax=Nonomuraea guangzhouensis TaxID=1291555 RepID=A0ABW4GTE3_9ACTN|nr:hypothetical protein [Nonomuraea guangzhouensis]
MVNTYRFSRPFFNEEKTDSDRSPTISLATAVVAVSPVSLEVLPQQPVDVLAGAALPGAVPCGGEAHSAWPKVLISSSSWGDSLRGTSPRSFFSPLDVVADVVDDFRVGQGG